MPKISYENYSDAFPKNCDYLVREKFGDINVYEQQAKSILTKASGFINGYDFSLNPYRGCQYGCSYCYAAAFSPNQKMRKDWGNWVIVKENAAVILQKELDKWYEKNVGRSPSIYMSTVTDPYQPLESRYQITSSLLDIMLGEDYNPRPTLVIQTRSPIITRDIGYLQRFKNLRINMSIPTGSEAVRKDFEPRSPSINARIKALEKIKNKIEPLKGFMPKLSVTITPLLPTFPEDIESFIDRLNFVDRIVIQDFHMNSKSSLVASTREDANAIKEKYDWWYQSGVEKYQDFKQQLIQRLPNIEIMEGKAGFGYE